MCIRALNVADDVVCIYLLVAIQIIFAVILKSAGSGRDLFILPVFWNQLSDMFLSFPVSSNIVIAQDICICNMKHKVGFYFNIIALHFAA